MKTETPKKKTMLDRQMDINNDNKKIFLIDWHMISGEPLPEKTLDTITKNYIGRNQGTTCLFAPDAETAKERFYKSFNIVSREFEITSIKECPPIKKQRI